MYDNCTPPFQMIVDTNQADGYGMAARRPGLRRDGARPERSSWRDVGVPPRREQV